MSYNISRFLVRSVYLELLASFDFCAWVKTLPMSIGKQWCLEGEVSVSVDLTDNTWEVVISNNGQELSGIVKDSLLLCTSVSWKGVGSGHTYRDILLPLFKDFGGSLIALVIWEGGDSIQRLSIVDGVVTETDVE